MYLEEQTSKKIFGSDSTMGLFVGLYLILLAFFIMLTAVSSPSTDRASAAMESVNSTFEQPIGSFKPDSVQSDLTISSSDPTLLKIQNIFNSEFDIKGEFSIRDGNIFQVRMPVDYLFESGSYLVRETVHPLINQVVEGLADAPYGTELEMALMFGIGQRVAEREMTRTQEVAVRRAGSFARYVEARGQANFSAGFVSIPVGEILVIFRVTPNGVRNSSVARGQG
jgi:hypothetical protein